MQHVDEGYIYISSNNLIEIGIGTFGRRDRTVLFEVDGFAKYGTILWYPEYEWHPHDYVYIHGENAFTRRQRLLDDIEHVVRIEFVCSGIGRVVVNAGSTCGVLVDHLKAAFPRLIFDVHCLYN